MGLERRSRREDTFENQYVFILATLSSKIPTYIIVENEPFSACVFFVEIIECLHLILTQQKNAWFYQAFSANLRVEDGARTHDLRNHNPLL